MIDTLIEKINNKYMFGWYELMKVKDSLIELRPYYNTISILEFDGYYIIDANDSMLLSISEQLANEIGIETIF